MQACHALQLNTPPPQLKLSLITWPAACSIALQSHWLHPNNTVWQFRLRPCYGHLVECPGVPQS